MVLYWCLFDWLFRHAILRLRTVRAAGFTLLLLALPPWLAYFFPSFLPDGESAWYASHRTGKLDDDPRRASQAP